MAHTCPDCGLICYCNGDIDDCLFGNTADEDACDHCLCHECGETMEWCICDPPDYEETADYA